MGHRKKPGAPGKTTIPHDVVASVTERLLAVFREFQYDLDHHVFIVPQQCYLYVEVRRKPFGERIPNPPVTKGSTTHSPLGRLKYLGDAQEWEYQPYRYSDEFWDDRGVERGEPEDLMLAMLVDKIS